jgi:hypothetical protein
MSLKQRFAYFEKQLKKFQDGDPATKREIISKAHPCLIQLIAEIGLNILKGNIKLKDDQYKTLKPYKRMLLALCKPGKKLKERRAVLKRTIGGFLPKVLPAILSAVAGFSGHALAGLV